MERLIARFRSARTQVLGVSVDSVFSHANWARSMGGISFPLLSDFHPKGAMARSYGLYLEDKGITDRATVIVDASGIVRHASSVTPAGRRNIEDLAALCEGVDREHGEGLPTFPEPDGVPRDATLFFKNACGASRAALLAVSNLHLDDRVTLRNISEDPAARQEIVGMTGKDQAPCLVIAGRTMHESRDIIARLVTCATDIPG